MKSTKLFLAALLGLILSTGSYASSGDSISLKNCTLSFTNASAEISLSYPQIQSSLAREFPLMDSLNRVVFATLSAYPPYEYKGQVIDSKSLELYCVSIAAKLAQYGRQSSLDPIPFRFFSSWWAFGNDLVASVFIKQYSYSGGAHGYTMGTFLNFSTQTGTRVDIESNIADTALLLDIAAEQFCRERRLPKGALRLQTGLFCELSSLPMPSQMGFSDRGLELYYNQYEIAPYSMGPIEITIPYKYFKSVLSEKFAVSKMRTGGSQLYNKKMKIEQKSERKK